MWTGSESGEHAVIREPRELVRDPAEPGWEERSPDSNEVRGTLSSNG